VGGVSGPRRRQLSIFYIDRPAPILPKKGEGEGKRNRLISCGQFNVSEVSPGRAREYLKNLYMIYMIGTEIKPKRSCST
jgi:hypothetical protein